MKRYLLYTVFVFAGVQFLFSMTQVTISRVKGEVQIRRGLDEQWLPASEGQVLKTVDTILTGERGTVTLDIKEGLTFTLGPNAILDIAELREITEQELFLYLTSRKVRGLPPSDKGKIHIENVSVVRGSRTAETSASNKTLPQHIFEKYRREMNGAKALQAQAFHANAILKLDKIKQRYAHLQTSGEIDFYLAAAFEQIGQTGRALNAYQAALAEAKKGKNVLSVQLIHESTEALGRLQGR